MIDAGYASQMFTEDDLPAEGLLVGTDSEPILLDRLQTQLHALANDPTTYTQVLYFVNCTVLCCTVLNLTVPFRAVLYHTIPY